jgi:glycosyltransferase involved in cell wall biosynthesis
VIVTHLDTGRDWRGGQGQAWLLMLGLRARDVTSRLLAPHGPLLERARAAGFETRTWPARGDLDAGSAWRAWRWLATERADLVHAHSARAHALGAWAARVAGTTPFVVSRRVDFRVDQNVFSRWKYRLPVDRYLCISRPVMEVMRTGGVPASRLALVPSGVTIDAAPPPPGTADLRALIDAPAGAPVLGTVAALAPHKDHATLLEAVPRVLEAVPDAHFVWLGEGECRANLERRRAALGLEARVHMPGFRPDAKALMPQFTLFVLSSHLEGLCTSLLDAQVRGVPIVATRAGGIPDVIESGVTGALVPPRDPEALAGMIVEALADPARRAAWAAAARESVRRFSADAMVENTLAAYGEVLEGRTRARSASISA